MALWRRRTARSVPEGRPDRLAALAPEDRLWLLRQDIRAGVRPARDRADDILRELRAAVRAPHRPRD